MVSGILVREEQGLDLDKIIGAEVIEAKRYSQLVNGKLPSDPKESRTLHMKAAQFTSVEDGTLYRRMFDGPLAKCLGTRDIDYILREIYEGTYKNHSGAESLVHKVVRAGYYLTDMEQDTKEFVRKCGNV
uniref:Uncharacterized protein LOC104230599 n=1 Tax=Nicotiana sylvestris TaxID=4096 RepID=A0A1U7WT33_NICSY|nr:PREDICTED: uncharacterized protein LOC104230599 [Nicotiana sylvestris]